MRAEKQKRACRFPPLLCAKGARSLIFECHCLENAGFGSFHLAQESYLNLVRCILTPGGFVVSEKKTGLPGQGPDKDDEGPQTGVVEKTRTRTRRPSLYRVLLLNDDYTPMEFVVDLLEQVFHKSREEAVTIMLNVHQNGVGVCGVYSFEVAETKVAQVSMIARQHEHPLQCTMEKA